MHGNKAVEDGVLAKKQDVCGHSNELANRLVKKQGKYGLNNAVVQEILMH